MQSERQSALQRTKIAKGSSFVSYAGLLEMESETTKSFTSMEGTYCD
jgi:hypothetical protein